MFFITAILWRTYINRVLLNCCILVKIGATYANEKGNFGCVGYAESLARSKTVRPVIITENLTSIHTRKLVQWSHQKV